MPKKKRTPCPICKRKYVDLPLHTRTVHGTDTKAVPKKEKKQTQTKPNKQNVDTTKKEKQITLHSDISGLRNPQKYLDFISWIAIPDVLREEMNLPKTQVAYAKHVGVGEDTLVEWKKRAGFRDDVMEMRSLFFTERAGNVILSLETKCLDPKLVSGNDVRVYLTAVGQYKEKQEQEHKVHPELQAALDKVARILPD